MEKEANTGKKSLILIFDFDGTLANSLPIHLKAFKKTFSDNKIFADYKKLKLIMGKPTLQILKELKKKYKFPQSPEELRKQKRIYFIKLIKNKNTIFPKAEKTLKQLKTHYRIVLATGSTREELRSTAPKSFLSLFDFISTIEDIQHAKPSPDQLIFVMKRLKSPPSRCIAIGDSIFDAQEAKRAKVKFIGVTSGFTKRKHFNPYPKLAILPSLTKLSSYLLKSAAN